MEWSWFSQSPQVYGKMLGMAEHAGMDSLDVPRICGRQTMFLLDRQRNIFN